MSQVERKTDAEVKQYIGFADVRNLHRYIKVDPVRQLEQLVEEERQKYAERTK